MRFTKAVLLFTMAAFLFMPALAEDPTPWHQGDETFAFDATWTKQNGDSAFDVRGTWLHYAADNHRVGANLIYLNEGSETGFGVGPSYEYLFRPFTDKGRVFVGGDADALGSELSNAAAIAAAARVGYEVYIGTSAAVRFQVRWQTTLDDQDGALASQLHQYGFNIGIMLGAPKGVSVQ